MRSIEVIVAVLTAVLAVSRLDTVQCKILPLNGDEINVDRENSIDKTVSSEKCPDPSAISPCKCYYYEGYGVGIDCSLVNSVDEMKLIFQANFPIKTFYELVIQGQPGHLVPLDVLDQTTFGAVSFETVRIGYTTIDSVQLGTFKNSYKTLEEYKIINGEIYFFAFQELPFFTKLRVLDVSSNEIPYLPDFSAPLLETLDFHGNNVPFLNETIFSNAPKLRRIMLQENNINSVPANTFSDLNLLSMLFLEKNDITALPAGAISPPINTINALRLSDNNLADKVEPGAITGLAAAAELHLQSTQLQVLLQEVWEPVFLQLTSPGAVVYLQYNPLVCNCSIAWLVNNETFMSRLGNYGSDVAKCSDGTPLTEVDVGFFANCALSA